MSRVGKKPVVISQGVTVQEVKGEVVVKGPKGELKYQLRPEVEIKIEGEQLIVLPKGKGRHTSAFHGLTRSLIANMVKGVSEGYKKSLKIVGTGYRVKAEGSKVVLAVGFSHTVVFEAPEGVKLTVQGNDLIEVEGIDKNMVGQTAANLRAIKPPDPYKGKGIRYLDEVVKTKPGKAGKVGAAGEAGA